MSIDQAMAKKVASLARIRVTDEEAAHYATEISTILDWMDKLQSVDTDGVVGMTSVADITLPMRDDEVTDGGKAEAVLKNAPASQYGCFAVPKVVE